MHLAENRRRVRSRKLGVERLEDRLAPAVLSFRAGAVDTEISALTPNANASTAASMAVSTKSGQVQVQSLMRFDNLFGAAANQIPAGSKIQSASLSIWVGTGAGSKSPIGLHRVNVPWDPTTATWNFFDQGGNGVQLNDGEARSTPDGFIGKSDTQGYRIVGGLGQAVQSWGSGANYGWVISAHADSVGWRMDTAESATVEHRPILTVNFTAPSAPPKPTYIDLAGSPPVPTSQTWFTWESSLEAARLARIPSARGSTFYFSTTGNDNTGTGDMAAPWRTLAKAQAVLDASSGDVRLRFQRGGVWLDEAVLRIERPNVTIDSYGTPTLAAPVFSRFTRQYLTGWFQVPSGGGWFRSEANPVGWLRRAADPLETLYYRASSPAEVAGRPDSWFYDRVSSLLYFNAGAANPNAIAGGLAASPDDASGWAVTADGVRLEDLQIQGSGLSKSGVGAGLTIAPGAGGEFAGVNVAVSFAGSRGIAVTGTAAAITLLGCSAGQLVNRGGTGIPGSGDATPFDIDAGLGGNELLMRDCIVNGGALPSADWGAMPGKRQGRYGVFEYTQGPGMPPALSIALRTQYPDRPFQVSGGTLVWGPSVATAAAARAYIVGENPVDGIDSQPGLGSADRVYVNDTYTHLTAGRLAGSAAAVYSGNVYQSWAFNTTVRADASQLASGNGVISWYQSPAALDAHFENSRFDMSGLTARQFQFVPAGAALGPKFLVRNSILAAAGQQTATLGGALAAGRLDHNAYAFPGLLVGLGAVDPGAVLMAAPQDGIYVPDLNDPLHGAGAVNGLEFDRNGQARPANRNDIGPVVGVTPDSSNRNKPYTELTGVGTPPSPDDPAWFEWEKRLRNARLANVPLERDRTYYFSQSGDDLTGDGTTTNPFKTLAWANGLVTKPIAAANQGSSAMIAPDIAALRPGGKDFTIAMWAGSVHNYTGVSKIAGKEESWTLGYIGADQFAFTVTTSGSPTPAQIVWPQAPDAGWHFLVAGFNSTTSQIFLSIDGAPAMTTTIIGDVLPGIAPMRLFAMSASNFTPGLMDDTGFWSSAPGQGGALSDAKIAALYRGGSGRRYEEMPPDTRTGLVSFWKLDEQFNPQFYADKLQIAHLARSGIITPSLDTRVIPSGPRLRFQGGDVWRENLGLTVDIPFVTVDSYGDGKAVFSRFTESYGAGWTQIGPSLWKRPATVPVGWVRPALDPLGTILKSERTSETTAGYALSFFCDANGTDPASGGMPTLYLNPGDGVDPNFVAGGYESASVGGSWIVSTDNVRLENLRVDGAGISPLLATTSGYGLLVLHRDGTRAEFVGVGLEFYFTGYHAYGHISLGAIATLVDCKGGLGTNVGGNGTSGSGDVTPYVSFADFGGQEFVMVDCEVTGGALPSWDWDAQPGRRHGFQGVYQHDNTGVDSPELSIALRTRYPDNPWQVVGGTAIYGPRAATLADVRGYIVGESPADGIDSRPGTGASNVAFVNCNYTHLTLKILSGAALYVGSADNMAGWAINTTLAIDLSDWEGSGAGFSILMGNSSPINSRYINCRFDIINLDRQYFYFVQYYGTYAGSDFRLTNSIINVSGTTVGTMGLGPMQTTSLSHNAYYFQTGYQESLTALDPDGVRLGAPASDQPPAATSPLFGAGVAGPLGFDSAGRPRASGQPDIGPLAGAPLPPPSTVFLGAGRAELPVTPGRLTIAQRPIDRIVAYFERDVDIEAVRAALVGENGATHSAALSSYDAVKRVAIWYLPQPFAAGRARLTIDNTWIGDIRFESGILRG